MAATWTDVIRFPSGQVAAGKPVTVYEAGTDTLATLYRDAAGTSPGSNPAFTDSATGQLTVHAAPGLYDLVLPDGTRLNGVQVIADPAATAAAVEVLATFTVAGNLTASDVDQVGIVPFAAVITGTYAAVGTAPVDALTEDGIIIDVLLEGTTIYADPGDQPVIADGETASGLVAAPDVAAAAGEILTIVIDQIGPDTAGADLTVVVLGTRA